MPFRAIDVGSGRSDAFVAKLNATGSALVYSTYLGGSGERSRPGHRRGRRRQRLRDGLDRLDQDFPTTRGPSRRRAGGGSTPSCEAEPDGVGPASWPTPPTSAAPDSTCLRHRRGRSGNAYVTGATRSSDYPIAPALPAVVFQGSFGGGSDAFVTEVNAAGSALVYSTYLGGLGADVGNAIAVDKATGEAYVVGSTSSADFPVVNAYQSTYAGSGDAFVSRLKRHGIAARLFHLPRRHGDGGDSLNPDAGIAVDAAGNAYVTSFTTSSDFPTKDPLSGRVPTTARGLTPTSLWPRSTRPRQRPLAHLFHLPRRR